jgi:hypothetical protein
VRRLSVASLDSGAESPVYGAAPSVPRDPAGRFLPPGRAVRDRTGMRGGPGAGRPVSGPVSGGPEYDAAVAGLAPSRTAGAVPVVTRPARRAATYDMSVFDRQSGRWYVKDIRASTQPMGTP